MDFEFNNQNLKNKVSKVKDNIDAVVVVGGALLLTSIAYGLGVRDGEAKALRKVFKNAKFIIKIRFGGANNV